MKPFAGMMFKKDTITDEQSKKLDMYLDKFNYDDDPDAAIEKKIGNRIYLMSNKIGAMSIFGIGKADEDKTYGVVWGSDEKALLESFYMAKLPDYFPYKVIPYTYFFIDDGEVYMSRTKGNIITTPIGDGIIYMIDNNGVICVELETDKSVLYEFSMEELMAKQLTLF